MHEGKGTIWHLLLKRSVGMLAFAPVLSSETGASLVVSLPFPRFSQNTIESLLNCLSARVFFFF
jgi:hypothetical protein